MAPLLGVSKPGNLPPDMWLTQRLDHFRPSDTRTWQQRYFINATFHKPGGPVFLMIGGEGKADPIWMVAGQWISYAQQYGALCLMLEHRYYGLSHPTPDMSDDNLVYLSSEQALADLAYFRVYMADKLGLSQNKWIAFGGSYPGSLAAWFRMKYPHLVDGSVASSAPVFAKLNFYEYLEVVRTALEGFVTGCNAAISSATATVEKLLTTDVGRQELKSKFRLCDDIDASDKDDIANLFSNLAGNFENVVQYNRDNRAFEGAKGVNITIDTICGIMVDSSHGSELDRYAAVNDLILRTYEQKCQDFKYKKMITDLSQTSWDSSASEGGRQWMYQTCVEFGYYQTSDYDKQPFGHHFPLNFMVQQCKDIFGAAFTQDLTQAGINWTNANYGGLGLHVDCIVFPNGSTDPWHALGITSDLSPNATALFIKDAAHCANMYPDSPNDLPQLREARHQIRNLIGRWISATSF
jgi:pimeloyl-ACP methyl ester carboxylesterase